MNEAVAVLPAVYSAFSVQDIVVGGAFLIFIMFFHTIGVKFISQYYQNKTTKMSGHPNRLKNDLVFAFSVNLLFMMHLMEVFLWSLLIVMLNLASWKSAAFFAANAYTTLAYGTDILPQDWKMLAPIIAMSGLFTFGWTGSVLVGFVLTYNKLRDHKGQMHTQFGGSSRGRS